MKLNSQGNVIMGIGLLQGIACFSIVALEWLRPDGINTNAAYTIIGFTQPTVVALLAILRGTANSKKLDNIDEGLAQTQVKVEAVGVDAIRAKQAAERIREFAQVKAS